MTLVNRGPSFHRMYYAELSESPSFIYSLFLRLLMLDVIEVCITEYGFCHKCWIS